MSIEEQDQKQEQECTNVRITDDVGFFDDNSSYTTDNTLTEGNSQCVCLKNVFDNCSTVNEVIETLNNLLKEFNEIKKENYELSQPINNGYAFLEFK